MANLSILIVIFLMRSSLTKYIPQGYSPGLTYRDVADMELYPRTKKEELGYWVEVAFGLTATTLWLFLPFGVIAYFIRLGSG